MTLVPLIGEGTARRQVSAAKAVLTRVSREIDRYEDLDAPEHLLARWERARDKLRAAEARLDAIRSQQPERHVGTRNRREYQ